MHAMDVPATADSVMSAMLWEATEHASEGQDSRVAIVFEALWKQIVEGERQQGERLSDVQLASEFAVSRTPVRQALHQLQRAGLVDSAPNRGFYVTIYTADDIRELYDLRTVLEVAAVRAATTRVEAALLDDALAQIATLRAQPVPERALSFLRSDVQLHHALVAVGSGNHRLAATIAHQRAQLSLFLLSGTRIDGAIDEALDEHEAIVRAILAQHSDDAAAAMERHIQQVKERMLRQFAATRPARIRGFHFGNLDQKRAANEVVAERILRDPAPTR